MNTRQTAKYTDAMVTMFEYEDMTNYDKLHWTIGNAYITGTLYYPIMHYIGQLLLRVNLI